MDCLTPVTNFASLFTIMEEDIEPKTYELAYHLHPDLEEADIKVRVQELNDLIAQNGGSVLISRDPRKSHLSYPIKNKHYAYFGLMDFAALPEVIEKVNAQMKLQNSVLRYLLLAKPDIKELRILGQHRSRPRVRTHEPVAPADAAKQKPKTKEETEQLEKDIEKVIEGL